MEVAGNFSEGGCALGEVAGNSGQVLVRIPNRAKEIEADGDECNER